jgi:hypothetical protein
MKTTIELPDDLYRKAKAEAALSGRKLKELVEEGLRLDDRFQDSNHIPAPSEAPGCGPICRLAASARTPVSRNRSTSTV